MASAAVSQSADSDILINLIKIDDIYFAIHVPPVKHQRRVPP